MLIKEKTCIVIGIIFLAIKERKRAAQNPHKLVGKGYFLSIQYFEDTYHFMERQTKTLHGLYAMSKLKFKSYKSFFQVLILLSGDVAMNPGPRT